MDWDIKGLGLGDSGRLAAITKQTMGWGRIGALLVWWPTFFTGPWKPTH